MSLYQFLSASIVIICSYYIGTKHNQKQEKHVTENDSAEHNGDIVKPSENATAVREKSLIKSRPSCVVLPALITDIPKVYDAYFKAYNNEFVGSLMVDAMFPGGMTGTEEFRQSHTAGTLAYWHISGTQYTFKCVDTATGEIIGMALGDILLQPRTKQERKFLGVPWLEGEYRVRAEKIIKPLSDMRDKLFGGARHICEFLSFLMALLVGYTRLDKTEADHLYLISTDCNVIAVDPAHQGRKAGKALIEWGDDLCEKTGMPIYLEATPDTFELYEKMGYEVLKEKVVHKAAVLGAGKDVEVPLMVKMPSYAKINFEQWRKAGYPDL
jgi:GNAT superfamily N-acetyltransferase